MEKKCRKCKDTFEINKFPPMNIGKYGVGSTCYDCISSNKKVYEIKKTPVKLIGKKKTQRVQKQGSEFDVFLEIWDERNHTCDNCNKNIQLFHASCFAHKLNKRDHPELRYKKDNIALVHGIWEIKNQETGQTYNCHSEYDLKFNKIGKYE